MPSNKLKEKRLGMNPSTASYRLNKELLYYFTEILDLQWCFHCGEKIKDTSEMSIEHKKAWLHSENPKKLFFDIENIAFSHRSCNYSAGGVRLKPCPSLAAYRRGCRCDNCKELKRLSKK